MSRKGRLSSKLKDRSSRSNLRRLLRSRYKMATSRKKFMSTSMRSFTTNASSSGNKRALKPGTGLKPRLSFLMRRGNPKFCPATSIEL